MAITKKDIVLKIAAETGIKQIEVKRVVQVALDKITEYLAAGQTVGLIEVMKTFHRVLYGGPELPPSARIERVVANDGDDLSAGDVIVELTLGLT